jgi:hypothetical protein
MVAVTFSWVSLLKLRSEVLDRGFLIAQVTLVMSSMSMPYSSGEEAVAETNITVSWASESMEKEQNTEKPYIQPVELALSGTFTIPSNHCSGF